MDNIFDITVEADGASHTGWVNPSDKKDDTGFPVSFHVVIGEVSFGYLSKNGHWQANKNVQPNGSGKSDEPLMHIMLPKIPDS